MATKRRPRDPAGRRREGVRGMKKLYTVVRLDFDTFDEKLKKVVELREQLLRALRELNNAVEDAPFLTLKEENPAPKKLGRD